ncbi:MAG: diguanylate cyclase [Clostridia bacterium]|nr:diguanylate cyclase [Clostridia bacterium]
MKKTKSLLHILRKTMYRYILLSFTVLSMVIFVAFIFTNYNAKALFSDEFEGRLLKQLQNETAYEARIIEDAVGQVYKKMDLLLRKHEALFLNYEDAPLYDITIEKAENGALYKKEHTGSSVYYSNISPENEYTINKMKKTEALDEYYSDVLMQTDLITQVYFNTWDSMNRLMPYIPDVASVFGGSVDISTYNFYYLADEIHNPDKKTVWVDPYYDPAGQGWVVSLIAPVYSKIRLEGVIGLDIPLRSIQSKILERSKIVNKPLIVINEAGYIVSYNDVAADILGIKSVNAEIDEEENITYLPSSMKIEENFDFDVNTISYINPIRKGDYMVTASNISNLNWSLLVFSDYETVTYTLFQKGELVNQITVTVMFVLVGISCMVAMLYVIRIRGVSERISKPLMNLADIVRNMSVVDLNVNPLKQSGIEEIDSLSHEFVVMANKIKKRTNQLVESQIEKRQADERAKKHLLEATTDSLTGVSNRRKFEDLLDNELKRSKRYFSDFCLIILDVDDFKNINDRYGHNKGDDVLKGVAELLKSHVRASDVVARWGGDEFVIMIVESDLENSKKIAEKIRKAIESYYQDSLQITISMGIAKVDIGLDDARALLQKADQALYDAKRKGRNCVITFDELGDHYEK